jgi:hypothetical protein
MVAPGDPAAAFTFDDVLGKLREAAVGTGVDAEVVADAVARLETLPSAADLTRLLRAVEPHE